MFKFAQSIFRHKVGVIAVIAFAVFVFSRDSGQDTAPASPWSRQATVAAAPAKKDDSMVGKAVSAASDYVGEATGIDPKELAEQSVGNFDKTNTAFASANTKSN